MKNSKEYEAAREISDKAYWTFKEVSIAYREQRIGDDEFAAAYLVYKKSQEDFDVAFAKESGEG